MKTVATAAGAMLLARVSPAFGKDTLPIQDFIKREHRRRQGACSRY